MQLTSTEAGVKLTNAEPDWAAELADAFYYICANTRFQRDIIVGNEPVSLSSLKGEAAKWKARYADVRDALFSRCQRLAARHDAEVLDVYDSRAREGRRRVWVLRRKGSSVGYRIDSL